MKNFLNQTWVKVIAFVCVIVGTVVLLIDGITDVEISSLVKIVAAAFAGIIEIITFVIALLKKKEKAD